MDALDAIFTRRSIRKFKADGVAPGMVDILLRAGMQAPSANNLQPWHFVVLTRREVLDAIPAFHPYAAMLKQAPLAILVCADRNLQPMEGYWVQDCSAATQNILLAAHAMGLGAVWLGIHPREDRIRGMRDLLRLSDEKAPVSLIAVGWPEEPKGRADRFNPEKMTRYD